ncbi:hypothetical protein LXL04_000269 [Taraxacum kok-saghyz]
MKKEAHAKVAIIRRIDPVTQSLSEESDDDEVVSAYCGYLHRTAITKVMAGSMLLIAHENVGEVNFNPALWVIDDLVPLEDDGKWGDSSSGECMPINNKDICNDVNKCFKDDVIVQGVQTICDDEEEAAPKIDVFFWKRPMVTAEAYSNISRAPRVRAPQSGQTQPPRGFSGKISPHTGLNAKDLFEHSTTRYLHTLYGLLNPIHHACPRIEHWTSRWKGR